MPTSATRHGITWEFSADRPTGAFANGDPWVLGPVTITAITPADSDLGDSLDYHGSMLDPALDEGGGYRAGFDSRRGTSYNRAFNAARSLPLTISTSRSLVSSISRPDTDFDGGGTGAPQNEASADGTGDATNNPCAQTIAILTVVLSTPAAGTLRPPYTGSSKPLTRNISSFDYGLLANRTASSGAPSLATVAAAFERPWMEFNGYAFGRTFQALGNGPTYGVDRAYQITNAALLLNCNFSNAQKEALLIGMVQYGIDIYGAAMAGTFWEANGGHGPGRKFPLLLAGLMCADSAILSLADASANTHTAGPYPSPRRNRIFGEDQNTFYIDQPKIDASGADAWVQGMLGQAWWGIRHDNEPNLDNPVWMAEYYQGSVSYSMTGIALAARMMGIETEWGHPSFFDYYDYFVSLQVAELPTWTRNMWNDHRAAAPYVGGGDVTPPTVSAAAINGAGTQLTLTLSETVAHGAGGGGGLTLSASGGAVTATYASGSGSAALVYTLSRTILQGETITRSYTQPGNGIEDTSGNDLASFSAQAVTNNSTQTTPYTGAARRTLRGIGRFPGLMRGGR